MDSLPKQRKRNGAQIVQEIRKQADDARSYTMSMPYRVQRIEEFVKQLKSGSLKLQVRVLEELFSEVGDLKRYYPL